MKNMKTRIAAAACAAITAVCGMQAMSASAFNYNHPYSGNTQSYCEEPRNMSYNLHAWQSYGYPENGTFTQSIKAGTCVGKGFTTTHISSYTNGTTLKNSIGWVRFLANSHFGFEPAKAAWLELPKTDFGYYYNYRQGDQIFLYNNNNGYHALFLTGVSGNTFTVSEINGGKIKWGVKYTLMNDYKFKRNSDGKIYDLLYVARPIKEGDANGDGFVNRNDVIWIQGHNGGANYSGINRDLLMGAADVSGNWWLTNEDSSEIYSYMYESKGYMTGDHRYVLAQW